MKRYLIIIEKTRTGYSAYVPDLSGCIATGNSKEQVEFNIYEAIKFHLEDLIKDGIKVPKPKTEAEMMVIGL